MMPPYLKSLLPDVQVQFTVMRMSIILCKGNKIFAQLFEWLPQNSCYSVFLENKQ